jgi:hypothetical protein
VSTGELNMLQLALLGFHGARVRHEAVRTDAAPLQTFLPLAEAVYWARVLDEALAKTWAGYERALSGAPCAQLVPGVRYARNVKTHRLAMTLGTVDGVVFPATPPIAMREVVWLPSSELPASDHRGSVAEAQRTAYDNHLAGRPVRHTLDGLARLFAALSNAEGSPLA